MADYNNSTTASSGASSWGTDLSRGPVDLNEDSNWSAWYLSVVYDKTTAGVVNHDPKARTLTILKSDGTQVTLQHNGQDRTYTSS